jgi:hypothetical protein
VIIEGSTHDNAGNLARYLLRAKPGEKEFIFEIRDSATDDLRSSLTDWELCGRSLTKGSKILFHTYIRLPVGDRMQEAQWFYVIGELEEKLGLTNSPRAIIGHKGEAGLHVHVAWSRLDPIRERLAPLHHSRRAFHEVARWAEKEFDLTPVSSKPKREKKKRRLKDREIRAFRERGLDRQQLEKIMRAAWAATDTGTEMQAMLKALGCEIAPGDRRDFVLNYKGLKVNPVRLLENVTHADFRQRMADCPLEREQPPNLPKGRRAKNLIASQAEKILSEDTKKPVRPGYTKKKRALTPRLRPKLWYGDPGI